LWVRYNTNITIKYNLFIHRYILIPGQIQIILSGQGRPKQSKKYVKRQNQIQTILNDKENRTTLETIRGIAYNLHY